MAEEVCANCRLPVSAHFKVTRSTAPDDFMQVQVGRFYETIVMAIICPTSIFVAKRDEAQISKENND